MRKIILSLVIIVCLLGFAAEVAGMTDVLMNSAETITPGNFKLGVFPFALLSKHGSGSDFGVAGRAGLGLTRNVDVEVKGGFMENVSYFGADIEFWFLKGRNINASAAVGGHMIHAKTGADSYGVDAAFMASTAPVRNMEVYGAVKFAFDSVKDSNQNHTLIHIVPGFEYRISRTIDFLAEIGIALSDSARSYVSAGLAFYSRR